MMWNIAYANIQQKQILAIAGLSDPESVVQKMKSCIKTHLEEKSLSSKVQILFSKNFS